MMDLWRKEIKPTPEQEKAAAELRELIADLHSTFRIYEPGKRVWTYLEKILESTSYVPNNPNDTFVNEGKRDLVREIKRLMKQYHELPKATKVQIVKGEI